MPLKDVVNKFAHVRFEPSGFTGNSEIPIAKSIVDYIFRWMGSRFLPSDEKGTLGLIDRSQVVEDAPASLSGASALKPRADEGITAQSEAVPGAAGGSPQPPATGNGNGKGNGLAAITASLGGGTRVAFAAQADAPSCAECGSIMVRNGSCYKCLNCGSTSGCS